MLCAFLLLPPLIARRGESRKGEGELSPGTADAVARDTLPGLVERSQPSATSSSFMDHSEGLLFFT